MKMILNTTRSKVSHIPSVSTLLVPYVNPFCSIAVFELQALFRQLHCMTPNSSWTLFDQRQPILVPWVPNYNSKVGHTSTSKSSVSLNLQPAISELQLILVISPLNPKLHWTTRSKVPNIWLTSTIFTPFCCKISHFQDVGNFSFSHWLQC